MAKTTLRQAVYAAPHLDCDDVVVVLDGELLAQGKLGERPVAEMRDAMLTPGAEIYMHPDAMADFVRWLRAQAPPSRLH